LELIPWFVGKEVVVFADNDSPGETYSRRVAAAIYGVAKSVKIVRLSLRLTQV
jgi:DNA primase